MAKTQEQKDKIKIPPLEYCGLERASRILDCEVEDLMHWGEVGAIDLCVLLENHPSVLMLSDQANTGNFETFFRENSCRSRFHFHNDTLQPSFNCHLTQYDHYIIDNGIAYFEGYASGLWTLQDLDIKKINRQGYAIFFDDELKPSNFLDFLHRTNKYATLLNLDDFRLSILKGLDPVRANHFHEKWEYKNNVNHHIHMNDLFVSRKTLEKLGLHLSAGSTIPNYINGGVDSPQEIAPSAVREEINLNKNMLGGLIDMLICSVPELGQDVANASTNKKRDLLEAFLAEKQKLNHLVDYSIPGYDTFSKYFKN